MDVGNPEAERQNEICVRRKWHLTLAMLGAVFGVRCVSILPHFHYSVILRGVS
jgi:hypothetical protein